MQIETSRFGTVEIEDSGIITFPDGIPGFETCHRFAIIPHRSPAEDKTSPFLWLQSIDNSQLAFLMAEPRGFFSEYAPVISQTERQALEFADDAGDPRIYTLLTVPKGDPAGITANLMAPVIVNPTTLKARQVIITDDRFGLRHRLIPNHDGPVLVTRSEACVHQCAVG